MMRRITIFLVLLLSLGQLFAQDRTITGKVSDENGAPLLGATVAVKGTTKGALTDIDGNYSLSVGADAVLVFSYVGYVTQELAVGTNNTLNLTLQPDVQNLEQVVVVGYGVQKKSLVTGSISKIDSKDITAVPAARIDQALQGKTSGVYVAQSSGTPGGAMSVKIRGNSSDGKNDPIYIVNGIKTGSIDFLSPSDIESIEVLKDAASCAIYGAEGGNGVVIISTKKGTKGIAEINYNYYHGWQSAANTVDVMDAKQYTQYFREAAKWENDETSTKYQDLMTKYNALDAKGINTNWIDEIFDTAPLDEHNISFTSGNEVNSFRLSASYYDQDGIIGGEKSNFTRYTFNLSADSKLKEWLSVGTTVAYTNSNKKNLPESAEIGRGIINSALNYDPTAPIFYASENELPPSQIADKAIYSSLVRNKDGKIFYNSPETNTDAVNPLALIENTYSTTNTDKLLGDVHAEIKFFEGLKFNTKLALDYALAVDDVFTPKDYYDMVNLRINDTAVTIENTYTRYYKYTFDNYATYSKSFENHSIEVMAGMSYENYKPSFIYGLGNHIPYNSLEYAYLHNSRNYSTKPAVVDGGIGTRNDYDRQELQNSYFGRLSYNFREMLMLQATVRRDGSSLFGPNNRYATFPSFSAGFNFTKLDFIRESLPYVNTLKGRFSWGQNGNKQILAPFRYLSQMSIVTAYTDGDDNYRLGGIPASPSNPSIIWETSQQSDIGLDIGVFQNKLTFSIDRFVKTTKDQLAEKAKTPDYLGFRGRPIENNGEVENKGWEFDLTFREMDKEFRYSVSVNASYLENKVVSYGAKFKDGYRMNIGDFVTVYEEGYPVWYFKGFQTGGIFQTQAEIDAYVGPDGKLLQKDAKPGDIKFLDVAGKDADGNKVNVPDGKIDESDRVMIGKPQPDWIFGCNFTFEYKGIDFGMFWQGVTGNQIFFSAMNPSRTTFNKPVQYFEDRWTGPGTSNTFPRATLTDKNKNFRASSLNIQDGDYLRLKNLTLGYTLPKNFTSVIGIAKLRVYVSGTNLYTLTKFKGTDPEIGQLDVSQNNSFGVDRGLYPQPKLYTAGVNVTF